MVVVVVGTMVVAVAVVEEEVAEEVVVVEEEEEEEVETNLRVITETGGLECTRVNWRETLMLTKSCWRSQSQVCQQNRLKYNILTT